MDTEKMEVFIDKFLFYQKETFDIEKTQCTAIS